MGQRYYPSQTDIQGTDKLERVFRDIYDRLYSREQPAVFVGGGQSRISTAVSPTAVSRLHAAGVIPPGSATVSTTTAYGTYANRPAASQQSSYNAYYWATDQDSLYFCEESTWAYIGGLMFGTVYSSDERPTLVAADAGFRFYGTDVEQLFIWDGSAWVTHHPHYGSMYGDEISQAVAVAATDTFYNVAGSLSDGGSTDAFTFGSSYQLTCNIAGTYVVNWSMSCNVGAANQGIIGAVGIDGTYQANTTNHNFQTTASSDSSIGGSGILTIAVDEVVTLMVANHTATNNITVEHANVTLVQV